MPSMVISMPPRPSRFSPVAVTMMSASSSVPEASLSPVSVKVSMWSVTTEALPSLSALKRSPSGTRQTRWSHGLYVGVKCFSTS